LHASAVSPPDAKATITGGVEDVNADGQVSNAVAITGGSYTVHADGRGFMNLIFAQSSIDFGSSSLLPVMVF